MPQSIGQLLSPDGTVLTDNVMGKISHPSTLEYLSGSFTLSRNQFDHNSVDRNTTYKFQLNDGRVAVIFPTDWRFDPQTENWNIQFECRGGV
jgi:hypothetical protein